MCIRDSPYHDPNSTLSWDWIVDAIPSPLHEVTPTSLDCVGVAPESENDRDLVYMCSSKLPFGYGFFSPHENREDRDLDVVLRSGGAEVGGSATEKRYLHRGYSHFI